MDATITNLSAERVFIPGPQLDLAPTGDPDGNDVKIWPEITVADLDGNTRIKELVLAGTISVQVDEDSYDAAAAAQGSLVYGNMPLYLFADLPVAPANGTVAFVTNGLKGGEVSPGGTGVPAYYDAASAAWLNFFDNLPTAA